MKRLAEECTVKSAMAAVVPFAVRHLLLKGWLSLVEEGWTEQGSWILLEYGQLVIWLEDQSARPVAVLTYEAIPAWGQAFVALAYTEPDARRGRCFTRLLNVAREQAGHAGLSGVLLGTHVGNRRMQQVVESAGMRATFVRYLADANQPAAKSRKRGAA